MYSEGAADYIKSLNDAETELRLAQREYDMQVDMHSAGMASDKELTEARERVHMAKAEYTRLQDVAAINGYSHQSEAKLIAPISGYVRDVCPACSHGPAAMLQPVSEVFVQFSPVTLVLPDPLVDGLMGYLYPVSCQIAGYLLWRPLVIHKTVSDFAPYSLADGTVTRLAPAALVSPLLCPVPFVHPTLA